VSRGGWVLAVLLSHWRRNPLQLVALMVGLTVATALWSGVQALNAEARASYDRAAQLVGQDRYDRLEPVGAATLDRGLYVAMRRAGWAVSPVLEGRVRVGEASYRVIGVEPLTLPAGPMAAAVQRGDVALPDFIAPPGRMLAAPDTLSRLGAAEGDRPETDVGALPPLLAAADLPPGVLLTDIGRAGALLGREGRVSYLLIDPDAPRPKTGWQAVAGPALRLDPAGGDSDLARLTDSFHLNLTAFGLLAFVVGLFIVHAAIGLAFEQRLGTIRTLRATGVSARQVGAVLLGEVVGLALIGGAAGLVAGHLLAALMLPDVAATLRGLYGADVAAGLDLRAGWVLAGLAMSLVGALIAAAQTFARAWTMPVLASARPQAWRAAQARALRWQGGLALLLLLGAGAVLALGQGLAAGFAAMAGLLIGAALLLPVALAAGLGLARMCARCCRPGGPRPRSAAGPPRSMAAPIMPPIATTGR